MLIAEVLENLVVSLFVAAVGAAVLRIVQLTRRRLWRSRARRLWPFQDGEFTTILASSKIDTGTYSRTTTGIGQLRAMATIVASIRLAWGKNASRNDVVMSSDREGEMRGNLVLLGGPKTNSETKWVMNALNKSSETDNRGVLGISQELSTILWHGKPYTAVAGEDGEIELDYGLILRSKNPIESTKTVVVLSGASTYGTYGSALWYTDTDDPSSPASSRSMNRCTYFAALVECGVRRGHVGRPRLLFFEEIPG